MAKCRKYSKDFKLEAAKLVTDQGASDICVGVSKVNLVIFQSNNVDQF